MKPLIPILALMLITTLSRAQQPNSIYRLHEKNIMNFTNRERVHSNLPVIEKLRSEYFLVGSRLDTFSVQNSAWGSSDSLQYLYSNDDSTLFEINHLITDPDSGWIKYQVNYYHYDAALQDTAVIIQTLDDQQITYENTSKITYEYDVNGNVILNTYYNWDSTSWEYSAQFANSYDANNNLLETVILNWNGSSWDSVNQFIYSYDTSNNLISETDYYYSSGFQPSFQFILEYNMANLQITKTGEYWNGNAWKNQFKDTLEYDINNNLIYFERKNWQQNSQSFSLTDTKTEYGYNTENQLTDRTDYNGDGASSYTPADYFNYKYDEDGNNTYLLLQIYDPGSSSFVNYNQTFYYYTDVLSGITSIPNNAYIVKLFPNPSQDMLQIAMKGNHASNVKVQVLDMNGRILSELPQSLYAGDNCIKLDVSTLATGVYYVHILNPETKAKSVNKFVKQ